MTWSWVHFDKRWKIIWPERLDSRVLEVTISYLQGTYGVEIRIESVNKDKSHSWVRISHGLNKLVTDSSNNKENDNHDQETSEMQFEEFALKTNVLAVASRSKAKAKPQRRIFCQLIHKNCTHRGKKVDWYWARKVFVHRIPSVKTSEYSSSSYSSTSRIRWRDWILEIKGLSSERFCAISTLVWCKKRFQYCTGPSGQEIISLRALQGHSGRNPIDPSLQDNVLIPNDFFEYIYHIGCAINLHTIMNSGLIPGGQILSKRQTVFFTSVDPVNKEHKDPDVIDLEAPRLARYLQTACKKHQNTVLGRSAACSTERIKVPSDATERHHPLRHTPSLLYPEDYHDGNWRSHTRQSICVTPAASEDFL